MNNDYLIKQINYALGETILSSLMKGFTILNKYNKDPYIYTNREFIYIEGINEKYMSKEDINDLKNLAWQYEIEERNYGSYLTTKDIWKFKPE